MDEAIGKRQGRDKEKFLKHLSSIPVVGVASKKVGVSRSTFYRWRQNDPEFTKKSDLAIEEGVKLINDMAKSQIISLIQEKNLGAAIFWLKHNDSLYSNKSYLTPEVVLLITQMMQSPDNTLPIFLTLFSALSPQQTPTEVLRMVNQMIDSVQRAEAMKLEQKKAELSLRATNNSLEEKETAL